MRANLVALCINGPLYHPDLFQASPLLPGFIKPIGQYISSLGLFGQLTTSFSTQPDQGYLKNTMRSTQSSIL